MPVSHRLYSEGAVGWKRKYNKHVGYCSLFMEMPMVCRKWRDEFITTKVAGKVLCRGGSKGWDLAIRVGQWGKDSWRREGMVDKGLAVETLGSLWEDVHFDWNGREISLRKSDASDSKGFFHKGVVICQLLFYLHHYINSSKIIVTLQGRVTMILSQFVDEETEA